MPLVLQLVEVKVQCDILLTFLQHLFDLRQRLVPVRSSFKIDRHSEEILAPSPRVIFDQTTCEVVLLKVSDFFCVIMHSGEKDDCDEVRGAFLSPPGEKIRQKALPKASQLSAHSVTMTKRTVNNLLIIPFPVFVKLPSLPAELNEDVHLRTPTSEDRLGLRRDDAAGKMMRASPDTQDLGAHRSANESDPLPHVECGVLQRHAHSPHIGSADIL